MTSRVPGTSPFPLGAAALYPASAAASAAAPQQQTASVDPHNNQVVLANNYGYVQAQASAAKAQDQLPGGPEAPPPQSLEAAAMDDNNAGMEGIKWDDAPVRVFCRRCLIWSRSYFCNIFFATTLVLWLPLLFCPL